MPSVKLQPPKSTRLPISIPDPDDPTGRKVIQVGPNKVDTTGYSGKYKKTDEPEGSEPYALKVVTAEEARDHYDRTHHLINQEHFWAGTKEEFKQQFEKL